jgi:hypothetical protein
MGLDGVEVVPEPRLVVGSPPLEVAVVAVSGSVAGVGFAGPGGVCVGASAAPEVGGLPAPPPVVCVSTEPGVTLLVVSPALDFGALPAASEAPSVTGGVDVEGALSTLPDPREWSAVSLSTGPVFVVCVAAGGAALLVESAAGDFGVAPSTAPDELVLATPDVLVVVVPTSPGVVGALRAADAVGPASSEMKRPPRMMTKRHVMR